MARAKRTRSIEHQCDKCQKSYTHKTDLEQHVKIVHDGNPDFQCNQCNKIVGRKRALELHKINAHGPGINHECDQCDKSYRRKCDLKEHIATTHDGIEIKCENCSKLFSLLVLQFTQFINMVGYLWVQ